MEMDTQDPMARPRTRLDSVARWLGIGEKNTGAVLKRIAPRADHENLPFLVCIAQGRNDAGAQE